MTSTVINFGLIALMLTAFGLVVYFSPPRATFAQVCPVGSTNPIRIENGFFTDYNEGGRAATTYSIISGPNVTPFCIADPKTSIPQFSILSYSEMKSLYFDQSPYPQYKETSMANVDVTGFQINTDLINTLNDPLHNSDPYRLYVVKSLTVNSALDNINITPAPGKPVVIFISGNLTFNANFEGAGFGVGSDSRGGVVFIVQGDVNVSPAVDKINAIIMTSGTFCSAFSGETCPLSYMASSTLTINGSVIALDGTDNDNDNDIAYPADPADDLSQPPRFVRNLATQNTSTPAEAINYDPKYIVIFRDIFARELTIWSEIQ